MPHQFDLLPIELQASIVELRAAQVSEVTIEQLITRTLQALGVKSNKVQAEVFQMEERLGLQLDQIGLKLQADLQSQHGATNGMLIELRSAQMTAHPQIKEARQDVADLKKSWVELADWRSRVEGTLVSFALSRDESKADRLRHEQHLRSQDAQLKQALDRLSEIERLLELASSEHEAGGG